MGGRTCGSVSCEWGLGSTESAPRSQRQGLGMWDRSVQGGPAAPCHAPLVEAHLASLWGSHMLDVGGLELQDIQR